MTIQIDPQSDSDWQLVADVSRAFPQPGSKIAPFNLEINFNADYLAVQIEATNQKDTWITGGYLIQKFETTKFTVTTKPYYVGVNRINLLGIDKPVLSSYQLIYAPPDYFLGVSIKIWAFVGRQISATSDESAQIELAINQELREIKTSIQELDVVEQLVILQQIINEKLSNLSQSNIDLVSYLEQLKAQLLQEINQVDAGIYTLAEGLGYLLPNEQANSIRQDASRRLNLNFGFL